MSHRYNDDPFANPGEPKRGQCVLHRNVWFKPSDYPVDEIVDELFATGVNQTALEEICARVKAKSLRFKGLTATDLTPIAKLTNLENLTIIWAHKFTDVSPLRRLKKLKTLTISDNKRWHDLSQLEGLQIDTLDISGGIWNTDVYQTFEPLTKLRNLETLTLSNVKVEEGGLRPIEGCLKLKQLNVAYTFPTEDYAYLSVKMPDTKCDAFAPYVSFGGDSSSDVLVVGRRKPFLNLTKDAERLAKYVAKFEEMQRQFRQA